MKHQRVFLKAKQAIATAKKLLALKTTQRRQKYRIPRAAGY